MIIGKLRKRIALQQVTNGRALDGSVNKTYTTVANVWADVKEASQNEQEVGTKATTNTTITVVVRFNLFTSAIDTSYHITYNGNTYKVDGVVTDERKIYRTITAKLMQ